MDQIVSLFMSIEEFVDKYFSDVRQTFEYEGIGQKIINLTVFEKTIIYKYALDYYEDLNANLRYGGLSPVQKLFVEFLNEALDKLPDYVGVVYRGANLNPIQIKKYQDALDAGIPVIEKGFTSSSTSNPVAEQFSGGTVIFYIVSYNGKSIEQLSRYGASNNQNEKEVLFKSNTLFNVVSIRMEGTKTIITLEEIQ